MTMGYRLLYNQRGLADGDGDTDDAARGDARGDGVQVLGAAAATAEPVTDAI